MPREPILAAPLTGPVPAHFMVEAKWDGFRALVAHRAGGAVELRSRRGTDLTRAFPEIAAAAARDLPSDTLLDGELVIWAGDRLDFGQLGRRLGRTPAAASELAAQAPAHFIAFDLLLVLVVGLVVYTISARDPHAPPGVFDWLQLALVASAIIVDTVALAAIAGRISEFGFTPNRIAALGENLILLVNLAGSAGFYARFLCGRVAFAELERWQVAFLPVYGAWAAFVVVGFPPMFDYR